MSFTGPDGIRPSARRGMLRCGVSGLAFCAMAAAAPAFAQTQTNTPTTGAGNTQGTTSGDQSVSQSTGPQPAPSGSIVITGIRQSLRSAQQIKRNSDTVVDVITAQDIGALPDRSVTEALQRVPGVAINRFAGTSDPDHFSAEGSGVVVRGLTFVRSEFNGRDTFSTGVYGQAINFQDVPAELLGSVEVYKETTADRIEGGLSGTINMNLRLPFDNKGFHLGYDIEATYGDFRKKWSPVGSLLVSDNWDTGIGRIGLLGALSYSKIFTRSDGLQVSNFQTRDGTYAVTSNTTDPTNITCRVPLPGTADQTGFPPNIDAFSGGSSGNGTGGSAITGPGVVGGPCFGTASGGPDTFYDFASTRYAPIGGQFRTQEFDRVRRGIAAAAQWQSLDRRALLTAQFLRSHATEKWGEYTFEAGSDLSEYNTFPAGCLPNTAGPVGGVFPNQGAQTIAQCRVGPNGTILGASGTNWQGYPDGATFPNYQYDENGLFQSGYITLPLGGWKGSPFGSGFGSEEVGDRVPKGGMQHTLNNRQVKDDNIVQDQSVNFKFSPTPHWDLNLDAQYVKAKHDNLDFGVHGSIFADQELDLTGQYPDIIPHKPLTLTETWAGPPSSALKNATDTQYFSDPRFTFWRSAMDHAEQSRGHEWAFKGDVAYNFLNDGGFFKQLKFGARYSDREQHIKYTTYNWGSLSEVWTGAAAFMDQIGTPEGRVSLHDWGNFFRGQTTAPPAANYYNGNLIGDYDEAVSFFQQIQAYAASHGGSGAQSWVPLAARTGVVAGTPFLPSEIQDVGQKTGNGYAMLRFGREEPIFGNIRLDGNIGVRFVHDKLSSVGAIGVPSQQQLGIDQPFSVRCAPRTPPVGAPPGTPTTPGGVCLLGPTGYAQLQQWATGITPQDTAINKYDFWLPSANLKFGITNDLIFRLAASKDFARPGLADIRNFRTFGITSNGTIQVTSGNPNLKPITSENFDATLEWYFAGNRLGSITIDGFLKNIHNYIYNNTTPLNITSNGVTEGVFVRHPDNFSGTGKVRGFEVAYNQTYDFLPGLLSGFGLSANFTYVTSKGIPNSFLNGGSPVNVSPIGQSGSLPLAQLSKYSFNVQPFYERGPISIRVAYNWRSKFLLTESDVIFPYFPIWNDKTGTLDASAFYTISPALKIGVQAQNLTNEVTKTLQQYTLDGRLAPRSYFMNDRRFSFILRGTFGGSSAAPPPPPPPLPPPPPETQTCANGSVVAATAACPAPPPPPPPPPPPASAPERG
jgi:TonB-dependent receptor